MLGRLENTPAPRSKKRKTGNLPEIEVSQPKSTDPLKPRRNRPRVFCGHIFQANAHYYHIDADYYYPSEVIENTPEEVDAIIEGINRVNARWPGALRQVHPPKPKPDDLSQILWIMDSMAFWPHNRNHPPSERDIIAVATGVVPD
jgi:hypothetical protein